MNKYKVNLDKCQANREASTPIHFLLRAADAFLDRIAVV